MTLGNTSPSLRTAMGLAALALACAVSTSAHAATILFTSNLSSITTPAGSGFGNNFQLNYNGGTVAGITNTSPGGVLGYNFVYQSPSQANLVGAYNNGGQGGIYLDSAVTADPFDTQDNGYFLALDSIYESAAVDISVNTIAGDTYTVAFDYAGTQQKGFSGQTQDFLTVGLTGAGASQTTPLVTVPTQGFSGYSQESLTFTATSSGLQTLSFLAGGVGTSGEPPMTLLDNIVVSQGTPTAPSVTPEPSSLLLLSTGLLGLGGFVRWQSKRKLGLGL